MISYAQIVSENGFVPGFIGNTDFSKNFNFDRQCSHYVQATPDTEGYGAVYWATEPKQSGEPSEWTPLALPLFCQKNWLVEPGNHKIERDYGGGSICP